MRPSRFLRSWCVLLGLAGGGAWAAVAEGPEALYLAVEVEANGATVARPRVVGFEGRHITVERRAPDAPRADYRLVLEPREEGEGYGIALDLQLPSGRRQGRVGLLHGEERRIRLDGDIELRVLLLRVDSPEFRALLQRGPGGGKQAL